MCIFRWTPSFARAPALGRSSWVCTAPRLRDIALDCVESR